MHRNPIITSYVCLFFPNATLKDQHIGDTLMLDGAMKKLSDVALGSPSSVFDQVKVSFVSLGM